MSPPRKQILPRERPSRRLTDATQLQFSAQVVVFIISAFLTVAGAMWATTYSMRSDVRDILTKMESKKELDAAMTKLQDERAASIRDAVESMRRELKLQQLEVQSLKEMIISQNADRQNRK